MDKKTPTRRRTWLTLAFTLLLSLATVGALGYFIYRQRDLLFHYAWQVRPLPLLLSILAFAATLLSSAAVWGWMMNTLGNHLDYRIHLRNYLLSHVTRRLPGSVWYIAGRTYLYQKDGIDIKRTSLASGVEYAVMVISGLLSGLLFSSSILAQFHVSTSVLAVGVILGMILLQPTVLTRLFRLMRVEITGFNYATLLGWIGVYGGIWGLGGITLFATLNIVYPLGIDRLGYVVGAYIATGLTSMLFLFLPSTLGVTEVGLSLLLSAIMPAGLAAVGALLSRILLTGQEMIWALVWFGFSRVQRVR